MTFNPSNPNHFTDFAVADAHLRGQGFTRTGQNGQLGHLYAKDSDVRVLYPAFWGGYELEAGSENDIAKARCGYGISQFAVYLNGNGKSDVLRYWQGESGAKRHETVFAGMTHDFATQVKDLLVEGYGIAAVVEQLPAARAFQKVA